MQLPQCEVLRSDTAAVAACSCFVIRVCRSKACIVPHADEVCSTDALIHGQY
jgi:hypothetical protein